MKVKIGNVWYGSNLTSSTNPSSVTPFTKIIYLEHANFSGYFDPERDIITKNNLNYYHYKQRNPNDYSLQTIFLNSKITNTDKVCFILSPGVWKAQSPVKVSTQYAKYGEASLLRSNGFQMWNEDSCLIGFGCNKTTIEMDCNQDPTGIYDASCITVPASKDMTGYYTRHSYNFLSFNFISTYSHHNYFATSICVCRNGLSSWYISTENTVKFNNCILNFLSLPTDNDVYANGGTFQFYYTKLNFTKPLKQYLYVNRTAWFKNLSSGYNHTISGDFKTYSNQSNFLYQMSTDPQITEITV